MWSFGREARQEPTEKILPRQVVLHYPDGTLFHGMHKSTVESEEEKDTESDTNDEPFNEVEHVLKLHFQLFTFIVTVQMFMEGGSAIIGWYLPRTSRPQIVAETLFNVAYFGSAFRLACTWKYRDATRFAALSLGGLGVPCIALACERFNVLLFALRVLVLGLATFLRQLLEAVQLMPVQGAAV